jgi:hypothetical protein
MNAEEFMRLHADNAVAGNMPEVIKDLTPEVLAKLGTLMAGVAPPFTASDVKTVSAGAGDAIFDVTYTAAAGTVNWRETVRQIDGAWKIVDIANR